MIFSRVARSNSVVLILDDFPDERNCELWVCPIYSIPCDVRLLILISNVMIIYFLIAIVFSPYPELYAQKEQTGQRIYEKNCVACHGKSGKRGFMGAKDLTKSRLSYEERKKI